MTDARKLANIFSISQDHNQAQYKPMPRYFFHISDGKRVFTDGNGVELVGVGEVRRYVVSHVHELRGVLLDKGIYSWSGWTVIVSNAKKDKILELGFDLVPRI
jgi:hypothetical protein